MKTLKDCEYSIIVAGVSSADSHHHNSKPTVGAKEDFIAGIFFTAGSLITKTIWTLLFPKDNNKEKTESRYHHL